MSREEILEAFIGAFGRSSHADGRALAKALRKAGVFGADPKWVAGYSSERLGVAPLVTTGRRDWDVYEKQHFIDAR